MKQAAVATGLRPVLATSVGFIEDGPQGPWLQCDTNNSQGAVQECRKASRIYTAPERG